MMGLASFAVAVGFLLAPIANAGGIVQWDVHKPHSKAKVGKRSAGTFTETIENDYDAYFATCTVGTPPQEVTLQLDTGSSDIWLPLSTAEICEESECSRGTCTLS